jgi:MFS family permease
MPVSAARRSRPVEPSAPRAWARDFRLLMAGSFVSMLGSRISTIACPLLALFLTGSPFDAGLVAFAATIPSVLVYVPAGALVDRWDPRRTMLVCESGRGVAIAVVAVSLAVGKPSVLLLILAVIVEEILEVFSTLADVRCARDLVPKERASSAQAGIETRAHVVVLVGRPLGVFLFGLRPILPFLVDALSFVVSVLSIVCLKVRRATETRPSPISGKRLGEDIITAFKVLILDKYARAALALSAGTTLIGQALIMIFLADARTSGLSSVWEGLVLAASGVGGVLGAVSARRLRMRPKASLVLLQMLAWVGALVFLAVWGWRSFCCMAIVMAILSVAGALGNIEMDTHLFRSFDENMLARVTSFGRLIAYSASAVGPMMGGMLYQLCGGRNAVLALVIITSMLALVAYLTPSLRERRAVVRPAVPVLHRLGELSARLRLPRVTVPALGAATAVSTAVAFVCVTGLPAKVMTLTVVASCIALAAASSGVPRKSLANADYAPTESLTAQSDSDPSISGQAAQETLRAYPVVSGRQLQAIAGTETGLCELLQCSSDHALSVVAIPTRTFRVIRTPVHLGACLGDQAPGISPDDSSAILVETCDTRLPSGHS